MKTKICDGSTLALVLIGRMACVFLWFVATTVPWALLMIIPIVILGIMMVNETPDIDVF
mgnify:CR=1